MIIRIFISLSVFLLVSCLSARAEVEFGTLHPCKSAVAIGESFLPETGFHAAIDMYHEGHTKIIEASVDGRLSVDVGPGYVEYHVTFRKVNMPIVHSEIRSKIDTLISLSNRILGLPILVRIDFEKKVTETWIDGRKLEEPAEESPGSSEIYSIIEQALFYGKTLECDYEEVVSDNDSVHFRQNLIGIASSKYYDAVALDFETEDFDTGINRSGRYYVDVKSGAIVFLQQFDHLGQGLTSRMTYQLTGREMLPRHSSNSTRIAKKSYLLFGKWAGISDQLVGALNISDSDNEGSITISAPQFDCKGNWVWSRGQHGGTEPPQGTWAVACSNGETATGRYTSYRPGEGLVQGVDARGRELVMYFRQ